MVETIAVGPPERKPAPGRWRTAGHRIERRVTSDPYLWLEDVGSARATAWVKAENAKTLGFLERDPRYPALYLDALKIAQSKERIPVPEFLAGNAQHARKFAAKPAALGDPYLFYEVTEGVHGCGANLIERAHTTALEMTYFIRKLM